MSNHVPMLINWSGRTPLRGKKQFWYEECWYMQKGCSEVVREGYECVVDGSPMFQVTEDKLTWMKLNNWARSIARSGSIEIREVEDKLARLLGHPFSKESILQKKKLIGRLNKLFEHKEQFCRQRSKEN